MFIRQPAFLYEIEEDGIIKARAIVIEYEDESYIDSLAVPPEYQGKGYGSRLMNLLIKQYGDKSLVLEPRTYSKGLNNDELEDWYLRLGFKWDDNHEYMIKNPL